MPGDYSEELVELVALTINDAANPDTPDGLARCVLDALSSAGRLVPEDGPPRSCGCPRIYRVGLDPAHQATCPIIVEQRRKRAEMEAWEAEVARLATPWTPSEPAQEER